MGIRFRCMENHDHGEYGHGKYFGPAGQPTRMFNVRAILDAKDEIAIAEGELDCAILNRVGIPAVGVPGAKSWKNHFKRMLAGFSKIHIFADPDVCGIEFAQQVQQHLRHARIVPLGDGDVTDIFVRHGRERLLSLIGKE